MEQTCRKISWFNIASLGTIILGMIFGILAINSIPKTPDTLKYTLIALIVIVTLVSLISGLIAFFGMRKGQIKTAILGMGRNSSIQYIGPIIAFIMGMIGLFNQDSVNKGLVVFLCVAFAVAMFTGGLIVRSLRAYRKDKETYTYTSTVSYIACASLLIFAIAAMIGQFQMKAIADTNVVGYLIAFSLLFTLSEILCTLGLGILSTVAGKNAPKQTVADADSEVLNKMASSIKELNEKQSAPVVDDVAKLREYKKLLDEGVITQKEFDKKKAELLK